MTFDGSASAADGINILPAYAYLTVGWALELGSRHLLSLARALRVTDDVLGPQSLRDHPTTANPRFDTTRKGANIYVDEMGPSHQTVMLTWPLERMMQRVPARYLHFRGTLGLMQLTGILSPRLQKICYCQREVTPGRWMFVNFAPCSASSRH